jgi:hypothetical protein
MMASGQARWIGRPDIHVYCHNPMRETTINGRHCWLRTPTQARYCVVCPDAGLPYNPDYGQWVTAEQAATLVEAALRAASAEAA